MDEINSAGITVLGSTGSVGVSTLDVISRHPERFRITALTANTDVDMLARQCGEFQPLYAVMADPDAAEILQRRLVSIAPHTEVLSGQDGLVRVAGLAETDLVMAAIVGAAGLLPSLEAARQGKRVLLANKEALVMSGDFFMRAVRENNAVLFPIDSEHNAILQCLPESFAPGSVPAGVTNITLTASGGPFRSLPLSKLTTVTPEQACAHPNWVMGRKISVDSATMMNKGLEVIEAHWLFGLPQDRIRIVIHPQSVLHSMVEYEDGSVLAQLGNPDMRIPISHALGWPDRISSGAGRLNLIELGTLQFEEPDLKRFPCLGIACEALQKGGTAPAILNAANEVAVQAFLDRIIPFTFIPRVIERTLEDCSVSDASSLETVLAHDAAARECSNACIQSLRRKVAL